jgi:hypothetical protein
LRGWSNPRKNCRQETESFVCSLCVHQITRRSGAYDAGRHSGWSNHLLLSPLR